MQDQLTTTLAAHRYAVVAGRFQLLAIGPTATRTQVERAFKTAQELAVAPEQALIEARDKILDPAHRLASELAYPLDGSAEQARTFYADQSGNASTSELLLSADKLPPLSRANFLARLAARQGADADLLVAIVEAHAAIDAAAIFDILKDRRGRAAFPTPSLVDIRQGLQEHITLHSEIVIAAYDPIQRAASPLLDCAREIAASNDRYWLEALSGLMGVYRQSLSILSQKTNHDLDASFTTMKERADDSSFKQFENALNVWVPAVAPLAQLDSYQKVRNEEIDKVVTRARMLLADLIAAGNHEAARKVTTVCLDAFGLLPAYIEPFEEAAIALQELKLEAEIEPLKELIRSLCHQPALLIADIQRGGFGKGSSGQACALWKVFFAAIAATRQTNLHERPWMKVRDFVFQLGREPESTKGATRMLTDLLRFAETLPATPSILDILRADLSELEASHGPSTTSGRVLPDHLKVALLATIVPALMLSALLTYQHFNVAEPSEVSSSAPKLDPEVIPPAAKGERFKLDFVRYCHFQEERLRVIKLHVRGPEDIQAFNMLANDYNSRCSNFYYQDEDLKMVMKEVKAKKQLLEADAMRILSTWPWHSAKPSGQ